MVMTRGEGVPTVLEPRSLPNFVETKFIKEITDRALAYIAADFRFTSGGPRGREKPRWLCTLPARLADRW